MLRGTLTRYFVHALLFLEVERRAHDRRGG
jgi:hypothetical protein